MVSKIEKLTATQEKDLVNYRNEWLKVGQSTQPIDEEKTKAIITAFYKKMGKKAPGFRLYDSPLAACREGAKEFGVSAQSISSARYAQRWWCSWVAFYTFGGKIGVQYSKKDSKALAQWDTLSRSCHWFFPFENYCLLTKAPEILTVDGQNRLHGSDEMAIRYPDGWGFYYWHGVKVPAWCIVDKANITAAKIDAEPNQEVRRAMIEIYGSGKYLLESNAEVVHRDGFGVLLRKGDVLSVRVCNATQEPDGTLSKKDVENIFGRPRWMTKSVPPDARFKEYFLDVHPELRPMLDEINLGNPQKLTARNAVASTFGLYGEEYAPGIES